MLVCVGPMEAKAAALPVNRSRIGLGSAQLDEVSDMTASRGLHVMPTLPAAHLCRRQCCYFQLRTCMAAVAAAPLELLGNMLPID